jgi:hypothetical protein
MPVVAGPRHAALVPGKQAMSAVALCSRQDSLPRPWVVCGGLTSPHGYGARTRALLEGETP